MCHIEIDRQMDNIILSIFLLFKNFFCINKTIFVSISTDIVNPVILGIPADMIQNTDDKSATAVVNWVEPTATDNSVSQILTSNHSPGESYPIGVTTVEYTSVDPSGNTVMQSFTITINGMD